MPGIVNHPQRNPSIYPLSKYIHICLFQLRVFVERDMYPLSVDPQTPAQVAHVLKNCEALCFPQLSQLHGMSLLLETHTTDVCWGGSHDWGPKA